MALKKSRKRKAQSLEGGSQDHTQSSKKQSQILSFGNDPTVTILVGPDKICFHVHKNLLCHASKFFEAAFNGNFKENLGELQLPEDDVPAFEYFMQWLYTRKIEVSWSEDVNEALSLYATLINVGILADKYGIIPLLNSIMEVLFNAVKFDANPVILCVRVPETEIIDHVYQKTTAGSQLRRFIVACDVWFGDIEWYKEEDCARWLATIPEFAADTIGVVLSRIVGYPKRWVTADTREGPFWAKTCPFLIPVEIQTEGSK
ncbi:MAG: hypothetical protein Q9219_004197 [cf. Caloplaca sp. 3 TL-2023]